VVTNGFPVTAQVAAAPRGRDADKLRAIILWGKRPFSRDAVGTISTSH
jgi:hypothetical protein